MPAELASAPAVRERPIIFSSPMVRAILAGRKTQTRRPVKPQPPPADEVFVWREPGIPAEVKAEEGLYYRGRGGLKFHRTCPYGVPGDRLWVREAFALSIRDPDSAFDPEPRNPADWDGAVYQADGEQQGGGWDRYKDGKVIARGIAPPWRSPMFMPRWAARLLLEVTDVRVQRVQDITHEDAVAEGFVQEPNRSWGRLGFSQAWASMYGTASWNSNSWVWVVSFQRVG